MVRKGSIISIGKIQGKLLTQPNSGELPDELFKLTGKCKSDNFKDCCLVEPLVEDKRGLKIWHYHQKECIIIKLQ
jgi:hypothetical protein